MKKTLSILAVSLALGACSKSANNVTIKSTFSSDSYIAASTMQQLMFGLMNFFGTVKYPGDWESKIKAKDDYII